MSSRSAIDLLRWPHRPAIALATALALLSSVTATAADSDLLDPELAIVIDGAQHPRHLGLLIANGADLTHQERLAVIDRLAAFDSPHAAKTLNRWWGHHGLETDRALINAVPDHAAAIPLFIAALSDPRPEIREVAIAQLAWDFSAGRGNDTLIRALRGLLDVDDARHRLHAAEALTLIGRSDDRHRAWSLVAAEASDDYLIDRDLLAPLTAAGFVRGCELLTPLLDPVEFHDQTVDALMALRTYIEGGGQVPAAFTARLLTLSREGMGDTAGFALEALAAHTDPGSFDRLETLASELSLDAQPLLHAMWRLDRGRALRWAETVLAEGRSPAGFSLTLNGQHLPGLAPILERRARHPQPSDQDGRDRARCLQAYLDARWPFNDPDSQAEQARYLRPLLEDPAFEVRYQALTAMLRTLASDRPPDDLMTRLRRLWLELPADSHYRRSVLNEMGRFPRIFRDEIEAAAISTHPWIRERARRLITAHPDVLTTTTLSVDPITLIEQPPEDWRWQATVVVARDDADARALIERALAITAGPDSERPPFWRNQAQELRSLGAWLIDQNQPWVVERTTASVRGMPLLARHRYLASLLDQAFRRSEQWWVSWRPVIRNLLTEGQPIQQLSALILVFHPEGPGHEWLAGHTLIHSALAATTVVRDDRRGTGYKRTRLQDRTIFQALVAGLATSEAHRWPLPTTNALELLVDGDGRWRWIGCAVACVELKRISDRIENPETQHQQRLCARLGEILAADHLPLRRAAVWAMREAPAEMVTPALLDGYRADPALRSAILAAFARLRPDLVPALVAEFAGVPEALDREALVQLAVAGTPEALAMLRRHLIEDDPNPHLLVTCFTEQGDAEIFELILEFWRDERRWMGTKYLLARLERLGLSDDQRRRIERIHRTHLGIATDD